MQTAREPKVRHSLCQPQCLFWGLASGDDRSIARSLAGRLLWDLKSEGLSGAKMEKVCEEASIIVSLGPFSVFPLVGAIAGEREME